ncbi:diaminopimelate decarboxylase [Ornithinimicrobium ciconiae]|uniref:Diaminopimelate decarboxylase n=1 Tax=Ornithinimicrobium ciconiae TaxID=2594265 RepID=A0A516G9L3_9MICO|nr:diaminopimelate decarboxylase [Ornithinimicrobium ciconiae]QDO88217.1 diaminopimelate decarboxylase [Ornithinimicrobium ciconiae]
MPLDPTLWSRNVTQDEQGRLWVDGLDVVALAREFGTPAYVVDEDDFRSRAAAFRDSFAERFAAVSGGADVYYAGKAFLCSAVARWVLQEGLHLDVCSGGELAVAQHVGFPGDRIALHGNNKSVAELRQAMEYAVGRVVVDSLEEIDRLACVATELGVQAAVVVRVTVGVEAHTHEFIATAHEDQKFGFSLHGADGADSSPAMQAVARILEHGDCLRLRGLHSHIGSQIMDTDGFAVAAQRLIGLHEQIRRVHGIRLPELDLGGGFGIAHASGDSPLTPAELATELAAVVEREFAALGDVPRPRISVEPGRAIAGPSTLTLYEVGTVKEVSLEDGSVRTYVSVDGGMSDNIRPALYGADYTCVLANRSSGAGPMRARVVGRHCESGDILVRDTELPADLRAGDLLAVAATGAYCRSLSSQYNHTPRPPVVAVRDGQARVIVRRETIEDILALDVG